MKITKTQLREIIKEELIQLNENTDLDKVARLFAYAGTYKKHWDSEVVNRFGSETVDAASQLLPALKSFEKKAAQMLRKIKNDKMYDIYMKSLEYDKLPNARAITFGQVMDALYDSVD
jgi:hypothetical protein